MKRAKILVFEDLSQGHTKPFGNEIKGKTLPEDITVGTNLTILEEDGEKVRK
jgi:hypothetical protein